MDKTAHIKLLKNAELQYKFALALNTTYSSKDKKDYPSFQYLTYFTFQKHWADENELRLTIDEEKRAAMLVDHCAVHLMANQIDTALKDIIPNRFNHPDQEIQNISVFVNLIRNAFAHNPFAPVWKIDRKCKNKQLIIKNNQFMNTKGLHGKPMRRSDYGGPLALLWLSKYIREHLLK